MLKKEKPNEVYDRIFKLTNGNPISIEQINTEIVCEIESRYKSKCRR